MFGYVKTDVPNMYVKDTVLYKAMYCGLCKAIGKCTNQKGRFCLNYDLTFLSLICHNLLDIDVAIEKQKCVLHRIRKRPIAVVDELSERIGALNVILAYYKLSDNVLDEKKGKTKRAFFKSSYKKAKKKEPIFDKIVNEEYQNLLKYEKLNTDSIDMACDPFGNMMQRLFKEILGEKNTEHTEALAYFLGKWIYLIDALDDFDKDKKKGNFNVLVNAYKNAKDKKELTEKYSSELGQIFGQLINGIFDCAEKLEYKFNHDLIDNILKRGIFQQTKLIMEKNK